MRQWRSLFACLVLYLPLILPGTIAAAPASSAESEGLQLDSQERQWLNSHPVIRVGVDKDFAPYEFINETGILSGISADHLRLLEKKLGVRFEIISKPSWPEILAMARRGEIDMLTAVVRTPVRENYLIYTPAYQITSAIIIDDGEGKFIENLNNLNGKRVAIEKGYFMQELLQHDYPAIRLLLVDNTRQALIRVTEGKADAYIGDAAAANYSIRKMGFQGLRFSGQTPYRNGYCLAVSKMQPVLASILDKALASIPAQQKNEILDRWLGLKVERGIQLKDLLVYILPGAGFIIILISWLVYLQREVGKRKRTEQILADAAASLRESSALYRQLTEDISDVIWKLDKDLIITYISPADQRLRGYPPEEIIGCSIFEMFTPEGVEIVRAHVRQRQESEILDIETGPARLEVPHHCKDGRIIWGEIFSTPERDEEGNICGFHGITRDITQRRHMEEQIRQLAFYDTLTGLPNRRLLSDRLAQAMAQSERSGQRAALMFLDLDNFKLLNDTHGHGAGDSLLIEAAHRLRHCIRETDTVARLGGDEFVVILGEIGHHPDAARLAASQVAHKICLSLAEPYTITLQPNESDKPKISHHCTVSIGIVLFYNHQNSHENLLKWADVAMYQAKTSGRNQIRFYQGEMTEGDADSYS